MSDLPFSGFLPDWYHQFHSPVTLEDCGKRCAPYNPHGIPFCCDLCHSIPVAYRSEWGYLKKHTDLWHAWQGNECSEEPVDPAAFLAEMPDYLCLLACKGPDACLRQFRTISCRQFPFFPYITRKDRFIGMAYHWDFEQTCWVIQNLNQVSAQFRREFFAFYDQLFQNLGEDFENYACLSEDMREVFSNRRKRIPLLHRNGFYYQISPGSERMTRVNEPEVRRENAGPFADGCNAAVHQGEYCQ